MRSDSTDTLIAVGLVVVAGLVLVVWGGAALAATLAGSSFSASLTAAVTVLPKLASHVSDPAEAWPPAAGSLPAAPLYWTSTLFVAAGMAATLWVLWRLVIFLRPVGTLHRRSLGVNSRARFARTAELAPLIVPGPQPGRFGLGWVGRHLVATENRNSSPTAPPWRRPAVVRRRGDRGAVALVGPSRCGKTAAVISGILEWDGPAVLSSVKEDLLGATIGWRSRLPGGQVRIWDPTNSAGRGCAGWSPLRGARSIQGAQRAARALCDAAPHSGVEGGADFWLALGEPLLAGLLFVAARHRRSMDDVVRWVLTEDRPTDGGHGEVRPLIEALFAHPDAAVEADAQRAAGFVVSIWKMDDRTRSSVYATVQTAVWPWADPGVARASVTQEIDLDWLLSGPNTLYLCAPPEDQLRLAPAFGGLLNDVLRQCFQAVAANGSAIDPTLLMVIDEAGNTPLRDLPLYASTVAGLGVQLITVWQSLAQIHATYGAQADSILTNHLTKILFAGLSDPASLEYAAKVLGDEEVETRSLTEGAGGWRDSTQLSTTRTLLTPPHVLRQQRPGHALLVHSTLPPAHLRTRPYFQDRRLNARAVITAPDSTEPTDSTENAA